eukprot:scaffold273_cov242-Pinguiococcus_pyrenoidosus.AAC.7
MCVLCVSPTRTPKPTYEHAVPRQLELVHGVHIAHVKLHARPRRLLRDPHVKVLPLARLEVQAKVAAGGRSSRQPLASPEALGKTFVPLDVSNLVDGAEVPFGVELGVFLLVRQQLAWASRRRSQADVAGQDAKRTHAYLAVMPLEDKTSTRFLLRYLPSLAKPSCSASLPRFVMLTLARCQKARQQSRVRQRVWEGTQVCFTCERKGINRSDFSEKKVVLADRGLKRRKTPRQSAALLGIVWHSLHCSSQSLLLVERRKKAMAR